MGLARLPRQTFPRSSKTLVFLERREGLHALKNAVFGHPLGRLFSGVAKGCQGCQSSIIPSKLKMPSAAFLSPRCPVTPVAAVSVRLCAFFQALQPHVKTPLLPAYADFVRNGAGVAPWAYEDFVKRAPLTPSFRAGYAWQLTIVCVH